MSDLRRRALEERLKKYDEVKKLLAGGPVQSVTDAVIVTKVRGFVDEYVRITLRDGGVAPYLGSQFVEEVLTLVLGHDLRFQLQDLDLSDIVRVVREELIGGDAR